MINLIPASPQLAECKHETPMALFNGTPDGTGINFDRRLRQSLAGVAVRDDAVLTGCPPPHGSNVLPRSARRLASSSR